MTTKQISAALLALSFLALSSGAHAARYATRDRAASERTGRQTEAPPWSFACMKDHGPSQCGEPMWVYGN
jgi:hypothetical protein